MKLIHRDLGLDLDREAEGQLRDTDRGPGMGAGLGTPQVEDEVREAVDAAILDLRR